MGEVYLAEDISLGRKVAVKFLSAERAADPESRKRFIHEARAQALVSHPNVASFYEVVEEKDKVFIVMEYIEGQKLSELAKTEKLSLPEILDLAIQIGEGLQAAHEKGVMHRDINPANILVTSKRTAKITDFGLAKWKGASTITGTGLQMGTDSYMSPEQLEGRKADFRTDIFSFGVVLYELICSRRPFEGNNRETLFYEILYTQPQPLARYNNKISENLQRIVSKCLAKKPEERYQSMADLMADLKKERQGIQSGTFTPLSKSKKWLSFLVPAGLGLAVLLLLIFKPFNIEIGSQKESEAAENSLAIMYFENLADPEDKEKTAQMITSLLITDLSESEYMSVVSQQRLYDILKLLGKEGSKTIDREVASEVAEKAGAKWILTGKVMQAQPALVVTAEVSEPKGGKILAAQRVSGAPNEDLFAVVDKLSAEVKKDLKLPPQAQAEAERPVADAATHSTEAYRYYLEGMDYLYKLYFPEAEKSFRKAIDLDSTFAMAYYQLAHSLDTQGKPESRAAALQAVKYSGKVGPLEKRYIKSREARLSGNVSLALKEFEKITADFPQEKDAFFIMGAIYVMQLGQPEKGIGPLLKTIELDPLYKRAYNTLAYAYNDLGDFEKSIWAINKYIELAPEEANPYDTRGDLYAYNGKLDQAAASYRQALEKKPDFFSSLNKLGYMHLFKRDYARAESCFQALASSGDKGIRSEGRLYLAQIPLYQGKFNQALEMLEQGIAADRLERAEGTPLALKHFSKALIHREKRDWKAALKEIRKSTEIFHAANPGDVSYARDFYAAFLAENGEIARAEEIVRTLKNDIEKKDTTMLKRYWYAAGWVELAKGNVSAATTHLEKAARASKDFVVHYQLAKSYLQAGRLGEAVSEIEKILPRYDENRTYVLIWAVKIYYLLGLAYEKSGWNNKAVEKYQEFLDIWKNADPGIPEVEDARQRLARLKKKA